MPAGGVAWKPHDTILTFEEIQRLCGVMADLGVSTIKVTGGEPLLRKGTCGFIRRLKALPGIRRVTLTTNGLLLDEYLEELAVLDGVNVSLDSLDGETFRRVTRFPGPARKPFPAAVLRSLARIRSLGIPVKINCVPLRGVNLDEIAGIAALAEKTVDAVRFIELMPIGCAGEMECVPGAELRSLLEKSFGPLRRTAESLGSGPAEYYRLPGFTGRVGFINAVTGGFCEHCNRLRLSAGGMLQPCLSGGISLDLRSLLRSGASDPEIAAEVQALAARKPRAHSFSARSGNRWESRVDAVMSRIGG
jgi:cyclic pyranopterin phosphate synthase